MTIYHTFTFAVEDEQYPQFREYLDAWIEHNDSVTGVIDHLARGAAPEPMKASPTDNTDMLVLMSHAFAEDDD